MTKAKLKKGLWIGLSVIFVCFAAMNVVAYRQAYSMTHFVAIGVTAAKPETLSFSEKLTTLFTGITLLRPTATQQPSSFDPGCRALTFPGTNEIRLAAWYCPVLPKSPLVILFHGYVGQKTDMISEAKIFRELGLSVLLVDFRGSGGSSESYTTVGYDEADDVAAAVRYANASLPHSKLILYGISMGAAAELRAVHSCGVQPDAIIAEAVFDRMLTTVRHRFELMGLPPFPGAQLLVFWGGRQFGFNGFANNPVEYAASARCPVLFLHGAADSRAHLAEARMVYDSVPGRKWFKEFPGVGHAASVKKFRQQWKETVRQFLSDANVDVVIPSAEIR